MAIPHLLNRGCLYRCIPDSPETLEVVEKLLIAAIRTQPIQYVTTTATGTLDDRDDRNGRRIQPSFTEFLYAVRLKRRTDVCQRLGATAGGRPIEGLIDEEF